jgi:serine/threonine protein kinase
MAKELDRIGEYILQQRLGNGTFGEVWRATHHQWPERIVAIKLPSDPGYCQKLREQGDALQRLVHPNIVRAFGCDPFAEIPYLAMEYVPGTSLRASIRDCKISPADAFAVMGQVLLGLRAAHQQGILHLDIKPENILVDERAAHEGFGAPGVIKITDFGMRINGEKANAGSILYSGSLKDGKGLTGTLAYISPERRDGAIPDVQDDIYACGIVFYELLTGERPIGTEVPTDITPKLPQVVDDIFRRAVARKQKRFASIDEFIKSLTAAMTPKIVDVATAPVELISTPPQTVRSTRPITDKQRAIDSISPTNPQDPADRGTDAGPIKHVLASAAWSLLACIGIIAIAWWLLPRPTRSTDFGGLSTPLPNTEPIPAEPAAILERFDDRIAGNALGVQFIDTPTGKGALFTRNASSRIEYSFAGGFPRVGTLEWNLNITSGYSYSDFRLTTSKPDACVFTTTGPDTWWPGSTWVTVCNDGTVTFSMSDSFGGQSSLKVLTAKNTGFKFGEWHTVGISYGPRGRFICVDDRIVAQDLLTLPMAAGGNLSQQCDLPTIGEMLSRFPWPKSRYDSGFEGVLGSFRASPRQLDWELSDKLARPTPLSVVTPFSHINVGTRLTADPTLAPTNFERTVRFDNSHLRIDLAADGWQVGDGQVVLWNFGLSEKNAETALNTIKYYKMDSVCYLKMDAPSNTAPLMYFKVGADVPIGHLNGEDAIPFNPDDLSVRQFGGRWKVVGKLPDGREHWMLDFAQSESDADHALALIRYYGFCWECFVGRPHGMMYFRK